MTDPPGARILGPKSVIRVHGVGEVWGYTHAC